jgi:hypothetical protein
LGKILMSKFLLNLLVQISKALGYSKIKFYSEKNFPRHFRPSHGPFFFSNQSSFFLPSPTGPRPLGRPSPSSRPNRPPSSSFCTGAERARRCQPASCRPQGRPRHLHRKKRKQLLKLLQRRPLKALGLASHTSNAPSLSARCPSPSSSRDRSSAAGETPFYRLPSRGNPAIEFASPPFLSPAPLSELSGTRATGGRAPASSRENPILDILHLSPSVFPKLTHSP